MPLHITVTATVTTVEAGGEVELTAQVTGSDTEGLQVTGSVDADDGSFSSTKGKEVTWIAPKAPGT